jgi:hypothetical protein
MSILSRRTFLMAPEGDGIKPGSNADGNSPAPGAPEEWLKTLPEDLRVDPALKDFKDTASLAKAFRDTKAMVGTSIRPPGPEASPEQKKEFVDKILKADPNLIYMAPDAPKEAVDALWTKLGRPGKPEDYKLDGTETPAELRALAAQAGLTQAQFKVLAETTKAQADAQQKALEAGWGALKTEWGMAFQEKVAAVAAVAAKLGVPKEAIDALGQGKWDPAQVKIWANVAKAIGSSPAEIAGQQGGAGSTAITPAEAEARIAEIMQNKAFFDESNPANKALREKFMEYLKLADPVGSQREVPRAGLASS